MKVSTFVAFLAASTLAWPLAAASQDAKKPAQQKSVKNGAMSKDDQKHFRALSEANLAEIESGKLAQQKASSAEVKKFGQHMVEDHGRMLDEMKQMGAKKNATIASAPNKEHQAAMKKLQAASGESFDRAYMDQMVKDHKKALKLAQNAAKNAKDAELKAAAQKAVPEMQKHLKMAQDLSNQSQARGTSSGKAGAGTSVQK